MSESAGGVSTDPFIGPATLSSEQVAAVVESLEQAERSRIPIRQLSLRYPDMNVQDAYRIQNSWVASKLASGRELRGRKIGLTSKVMQQALSIEEPDFGALYDDMFFADGGTVPHDRFIYPRLEVELAFVLKAPLVGAEVTIADVIEATDYVQPALEILDSRVQMSDPATGHMRTIVDTIADNAADAGVVLGGRPVRPTELDLRWVAALLHRNGTIEESGVSAAVLGHPAHGVAWLAKRLAGFDTGLEAGQVILSGSFIRAVPAFVGDVFLADFGPLGTVGCRFENLDPEIVR